MYSKLSKHIFSPNNTRLIQIFILLCLCVIIGYQYNTISEGFAPSPTGSTENINQKTIDILNDTTKTYEKMTKAQLAEQLSVYEDSNGQITVYTADSPFIEALYNDIHTETKPLQHELSPSEAKLLNDPPIYYEPGTYMYNGTGYEPTYDELMLSRYEKLEPKPITNAPYLSGGFCNYFKSSPMETEKKCNELNSETCASTECCVLLSGKKCVAGDEYGAQNKANYSDFLLGDVDFYYYKGKCYGNCPR
jgi:hypothetical protein